MKTQVNLVKCDSYQRKLLTSKFIIPTYLPNIHNYKQLFGNQ